MPGQNHGHNGFGGNWVDDLGTWTDEVLTAGGVSLPAGAETFVDAKADALDVLAAANGTELPGSLEHKLESIANSADNLGDGVNANATATGDNLADKVTAVQDAYGDSLSGALNTALDNLAAVLAAANADGSLSSGERDDIDAAGAALDDILDDDAAVKLSNAALTDLSDKADDLHTLADSGFLALDNDQLAAVQAFDDVLTAFDAGTADASDVKEAYGDLKDSLGAELVGLSNDHGGGGHSWF